MSSEREPFTRPFTTDDKKKDLSERIKAGMSKAAEKGVRIGRPLAFCFLEDDDLSEFPRCASKPVVRSLKDIMDFSFEGKTISETASELGISRMTLTRALRSKGVLEQFKRSGEENRSKGIPLKRVVEDGGNALKREGEM